ncbi:MAG: hypothetical protein WCI05_09485 [Myxococcales bacterium]
MGALFKPNPPQFRADLTPNPLSLDILLAHAGKDDRLRERGLGTVVHEALLPPRSKTIFLARTGKENVEGEGGWGGEVYASGNLRFSRWVWFSAAVQRGNPCFSLLWDRPLEHPRHGHTRELGFAELSRLVCTPSDDLL